MSKIRLYELARELQLTNKVLMDRMAILGINVASHMSSLEDEYIEKINLALFGEKAPSVDEIMRRNIDKVKSSLDMVCKNKNINCKSEISIQKGQENNYQVGPLPPRSVLVDLAKELNCDYKKLFDQTKRLGFSENAEKRGLTDTEIEILRTINTANTVKEISDNLKIGSREQISTLKYMGYRINDENQNLDRLLIIQLVIRCIKENANKKQNDEDIVGNPVDENGGDSIKGHKFIIDGSNVCQAYFQEKNKLSIKILLSIVCEILKRGGSFISIFDANITSEIKDKKRNEIKHFKELMSSCSNKFCISTGRLQADDLILSRANKTGDPIISNDRFRKYVSKYSWILNPGRLIKGKIIDGEICIPNLEINAPVCTMPGDAISFIISKLN